MPKTSMHEDDFASRRKNQIGFPWEIAAMQAEPEAETMDKRTNQ